MTKPRWETLQMLSCYSKRTALHFRAEGLETDESLGQYESLGWGGWRPTRPIVHRSFTGGARLYDLHRTTMATVYLTSQRFVDTLQAGGFSGWSTFPVEAYGKQGEQLDGVHGLSVVGKCGAEFPDKGEIVLKELVAGSGQPPSEFRRGVYLDMDKWDGSDLFLPEESSRIVITDAVGRAIKKAKLQNVTLTPLPRIETLVL